MGADTKIEWARHTWNLWRGCTEVSPACDHCYAREVAKRNPATLGKWGAGEPRVFAAGDYRRLPLKWNQQALKAGERHRVFALSMGDWLDEEVPAVWLADLLWTVFATPNLDWLLLTKRPQNFQQRIKAAIGAELKRSGPEPNNFLDFMDGWAIKKDHVPQNVWIGTTVEDQARADERIPELLKIPAKVRFLSCEPLLGPVSLEAMKLEPEDPLFRYWPLSGASLTDGMNEPVCQRNAQTIHWVIAGGESGHKARPMHPEWVLSLRDQCQASGVPFFFKQWGEFEPATLEVCEAPMRFVEMDGTDSTDWKLDRHSEGTAMMCRTGKKAAGRRLDGREWSEFPTMGDAA